jgi:uncharacterized protein (TIGR00251 family)
MHEYFRYDVKNNSATLNVKLKPASKQDLIEEYLQINQKYYLKIRVKAGKIDGKANAALIKLLSNVFKIVQSNISITNGLISEYKSILIKNIEYNYLKSILDHYIKE